jgi:hypothetical protein
LTSSSRFLTDSWSGGHLELAAGISHLKPTATLVAVLQTAFFFLLFTAGDPTAKLVVRIIKDGDTSLMYPGRG